MQCRFAPILFLTDIERSDLDEDDMVGEGMVGGCFFGGNGVDSSSPDTERAFANAKSVAGKTSCVKIE